MFPPGNPVPMLPNETPVVAVELLTDPENKCVPVHVGAIDCERAGAPSLRMQLDADPLTAVKPTTAVGFAPAQPVPLGVAHMNAEPFHSSAVPPVVGAATNVEVPTPLCTIIWLIKPPAMFVAVVAVAALPVVFWFNVGTSAGTSARHATAPAPPEAGPA